jgi:hypothetical protein
VTQLALYPERVRMHATYEPLIGGPTEDEVVSGTVTDDFGNGDVSVRFDGVWRIGSVAGCHLIVRRDNLEPAAL